MSSEAAADSAEVRAAAEADAEAKALAEARASQQRLAAAAEAAAAARAQCDLECKARRDAELRTSSMERLLREQLDETLKQAEAASIASSIAASLVYRASLSDLEEEIESERQTHRKVLEASRTRAVKMLAAKDELLVKARAGAEEAHRAKRSGVSAGINTERSTERADSSPTESSPTESSPPESSPPESSQGLGTPALAAKQLAAGDEEALASRFAHRITSLEGALNASREQLTQLRSEHEEALRQKKLLGARVSRAERASRHGSSEYIHNVMVRYLSLPESERAAMIPVLAALFGFNAVETAHVVAAATPQQGGLRGWVFGTPRTPSMATPRRVPAHLSTPSARAHLASEPRVGCAAAAGGGGGGGALERAAAERVSR